jgi:hypothetical protein
VNALNQDELADDPSMAVSAALLYAMSDDQVKLTAALTTLEIWADSEDPQDRAARASAQAAAAASTGDHKQALHHARQALGYVAALGLRSEGVRWAWPIAADAALMLGDETELAGLVSTLDGHRPGHIPPVLRAERLRIDARILANENDVTAAETFDAATRAFRDLGSPYHLAVGLLDHASYLQTTGNSAAAQQLAAEAVIIGEKLGASPLRERGHRITRLVTSA